MFRFPPQLFSYLGGVEAVSDVVPWPVFNKLDQIFVFTQMYEEAHELAVNAILLKLRKAGIEAEGEIAIEYGVVDIRVLHHGQPVAIVEVKTGKVKLIQSAAYAYITGKPVFVAEMRTGCVTKITPEFAKRVLEYYVGLLKDIKDVRDGPIIPNSACRFCVADCEYSNGRNLKDPARTETWMTCSGISMRWLRSFWKG